MLLPIMTSRLMLALREAATEPTDLWSFRSTADFGGGGLSGGAGLQFASGAFDVSHEVSETLPNEEGIELDSMPQNRETQQPC